MELPTRKRNRLPDYDYSAANAYFITVCTQKRENLLWENPDVTIDCPQDIRLSPHGAAVKNSVVDISKHYSSVSVDNYVIMPNHIHLLIQIQTDEHGNTKPAPTISTVIRMMKGAASKQCGFPLWQKGFYDHVIRGDQDYLDVWNYIEGNPMKWTEDKLYR